MGLKNPMNGILVFICIILQSTHLLKSNVFGILSEALTAHVDTILAN
jgi:hypothetical protein